MQYLKKNYDKKKQKKRFSLPIRNILFLVWCVTKGFFIYLKDCFFFVFLDNQNLNVRAGKITQDVAHSLFSRKHLLLQDVEFEILFHHKKRYKNNIFIKLIANKKIPITMYKS